jgi:tetraacyldisaccharide 4'-kinase
MQNNIFIKFLLSPIAILYYCATWFRNKMFDNQLLTTFKPSVPTICVGNLAVGGTGKTPMVEYIVNNTDATLQKAILSRGYGRQTRGFLRADLSANASTIGDEPYQFWLKFDKMVNVFVGENRVEAYHKIKHLLPNLELLVLDDGFQHRQITADLNIVLVDYSNRFANDWIMPIGRLREPASGIKRAQVIVVTKCPSQLAESESVGLIAEIRKVANINIPILFSKIEYGNPVQFNGNVSDISASIIIASGLANASKFTEYCEANWSVKKIVEYGDHHNYTDKNIQDLEKWTDQKYGILVTEKDFVKLIGRFNADIKAYYLPIKIVFMFDGAPIINNLIQNMT